MWFYNANNRFNEREEKREPERTHQERYGSSSYHAREGAADAGLFSREIAPEFARTSVQSTADTFDRMIGSAERLSSQSAASTTSSPIVMRIPSDSRGNMSGVGVRAGEGTMTSLYPAVPDPTEETPASKASAEVISRQIDGDGYWVTDDMPATNESLTLADAVLLGDDLAAIDTGYPEPESFG